LNYGDSVYRFLYARVGNREDAEDLTSQVFLKAAQRLDGARSEASVASWLFTVARTVLADHWRRYYRAPAGVEFSDEIVAERPAGDSAGDSTSAAERLVEAVLETLPPRYRRVLELRFLQGYTIDEAAAEMNVTPGNLKVLQHRALTRAAEFGLPSWDTDGGRAPSPSLRGHCTRARIGQKPFTLDSTAVRDPAESTNTPAIPSAIWS
jgi:RNA polymerase sigma-70 factor (ECF subfamily)